MLRTASIGLASVFALTMGCAGAPPPQPKIVDQAPAPEPIDRGPTSMDSDIGGLNEEAMDSAFNSLDITSCIAQRSSELGELGGELKLKLRIDRKGSARWAYLSESTLGDHESEKCVVELALAKTWPRPLGGDGLAEKTYVVDPRVEPLTLDERHARLGVDRARADATRCRRGVAGRFRATVYLGRDGRVVTAGVAVPSEKAEDAAECVVEALRKVRFSATSKPSKVSFAL